MDSTRSASAIFISTSIPYVNGAPHVGFAWELVLADVLSRYHRQRGRSVFFLTGTDDNSLKNVQAAEREGVATPRFVRDQGDRFVALAQALRISHDDFIRTGFDPRHEPAVAKLWRACAEQGDVYTRAYRGSYCAGCEQFYAPSEVVDGRCPDHETALESVAEHNHFFRLSRFGARIEHALEHGAPRVSPVTYLADAGQLLARGLEDFSISRPRERARGWGIGVPDDPTQTVYVWFDALTNYLSALDYATDGERFDRYWRRSARRIHVIGKNVTRFHCVYWPAILESAGLPAPTDTVVHGFLTVGGRKIGKSLGNGIDPFALVQRFGAERLRFYLLNQFPLGKDGDFSVPALITACNATLADQLGNLQNRLLVLIERHATGAVPRLGSTDSELRVAAAAASRRVADELERCAPDRALAAVVRYIEACNLYVSRREPWKIARALGLAQAEPERQALEHDLLQVLGECARALLWIAGLIEPFLPDTAERIASAFGSPIPLVHGDGADEVWPELGAGARVARGEVLFARLEAEPAATQLEA